MKKPEYADRLSNIKNDELRELMSLISRDDIISFAGGIPDENLFPREELQELILKLMKDEGDQIFQYSSTEGSIELKNYIRDFMKKRQLEVIPEEILITSGSQQGLDLLCKLFLNRGDKVVVGDPSYVGGIGAIKSYQGEILTVPTDADGLRMEELENILEENNIKFLYTIPDHSNPSGISLSPARREILLELADKYGFYILEDTPYTELSYYNAPPPSMKSKDEKQRVIYLGTFSKFFVPGLRIAWIAGPKEIIKYLGMAKQNAVLATNTPGQHLITAAGRAGLIEEQIEYIKPYYKKRLEAMGRALKKHMPASTDWKSPAGGFFYWVELPETINSKSLLQKAVEKGVAFVNGNGFFSRYEKGNNYMRLSFSRNQPEIIESGIKKLAEVIREEI